MSHSNASLSTSVSLVRRVRDLDPEAWSSLTRLYGPLIYSWTRKHGLPSHDAADVLQNVFLSILRGLKSFSLERPDASFRGWLRIITLNAVREWGRRRETIVVSNDLAAELAADADSSTGLSVDSGVDADLFGNLTHQALELVRATVDDRTWDAFWKTTLEDASPADVAASLEMSVAAVRQAKYRVLCRLRNLLSDR